jgi:predicted esterase
MTMMNSRPEGGTTRRLRILCLHGYHGSGAVLRRQMAPLTAAVPPDVDFVYPDAPSLARGGYGWWQEGFAGWEQTRDWAQELLRAGPRTDGILGFSQGAALTGLLAALRDGEPAPAGFGFAIMIGGFTSFLPQHAGLFTRKLTIPSVHVTGRADQVVPARDSLLLAGRFASPLVIEHPGGHLIPGDPAVTAPIAGFLARIAAGESPARALSETAAAR